MLYLPFSNPILVIGIRLILDEQVKLNDVPSD